MNEEDKDINTGYEKNEESDSKDLPPSDIKTLIKETDPLLIIASLATALFLIFTFIPVISKMWWLMLLLAIGSFYIFNEKEKSTEGTDNLISRYGKWGIIVIFLLRDVLLTI